MATQYQCQYSDQIRKKHKSWNDGVVKYCRGQQLVLYAEGGTKLATARKNSKELERILDPGRFGEEHRLFPRYVVTIESAREHGPSLALKMKPFKATMVPNRPSRRRPHQPPLLPLPHQLPRPPRTRIRHVVAKPIVI